jgi:hypothetical protein
MKFQSMLTSSILHEMVNKRKSGRIGQPVAASPSAVEPVDGDTLSCSR